ncbi:MAG TPA: alpha/beta fold hydrolase [Mycobacterium sp.]|nr:alpha/beta fold hydrolase [Mycobacterium sp.]
MTGKALPDLVLVHGGAHAADCWDPMIAELRRQEPGLRVLAVDLPGRRNKPGRLATATIAEWVDSVVADIEQARLGDVVVVGHSMAGVTVPGVVAKLGAGRVREMVLVAAFVPPQGTSIIDSLGGFLGLYSRNVVAFAPRTVRLPAVLARIGFCTGMTRAQRRFTLSRMYPDSLGVVCEPVDRSCVPDEVRRSWVLTLNDRALSGRSQRASIAALGGVQTVIAVDACHDVMISHPERLAEILIKRCRV